MKRSILLSFLFLCVYMTFAQTQQGIVKTRGRMVNGQLVAGQKLSGATITLNIGNPLVSAADGAFSFNVPSGKNYSLVIAKKQGYSLADPEYTRRSFSFSAENPFFVVLEDEALRQADVNAATRKVRRTLMAQLQAREDEIEALKEQNKLTEEEYQNRLKVLYDNQSKSEQLVKDMAERYASTDYDQLDEFNRQVQQYIEEGELQKADSMIRSKGDMEQRVAEYHNVVAANQKARQELEQSEAGAAKTYSDLSQDLLRRSEIFLQAFQQDSALYCLKMRADLDTTNVESLYDYAKLCNSQKKFKESEKYYQMSLRQAVQQQKIDKSIRIENEIGMLYVNLRNFEKSKMHFESALQKVELMFDENNNVYRYLLAQTQSGLGEFYTATNEYTSGERYLLMSLQNYDVLVEQDSKSFRKHQARVQNNLGTLYAMSKKYDKATQYYHLSLANFEELFKTDPSVRPELSKILNNMGNQYRNLRDDANSEKYYLMSLQHNEELFRQNPNAYRNDLARTLNNLGYFYQMNGDYEKSEKYLLLALNHKEELFRMSPSAFRLDLSMTQNSLGGLYRILNDYEKSEKYYLLALENREAMYRQYPKVYAKYVAATLYLMSVSYYENERYDDALKRLDQMLSLTPNDISPISLKGDIFLIQGKNEEALAMWNKVLELDPSYVKKHPDGTNLSNGLKKLGLID